MHPAHLTDLNPRPVYAITHPDDERRIVALCSTRALANVTAPALDDWQGHGEAEIIERQALAFDGRLYLLANDHASDITLELDASPAAKTAAARLAALAKLTPEEREALNIKISPAERQALGVRPAP